MFLSIPQLSKVSLASTLHDRTLTIPYTTEIQEKFPGNDDVSSDSSSDNSFCFHGMLLAFLK